jgi:DNA replication protein DnaC
MCGLEGKMLDLRFTDWDRGNWTGIDPSEQERRIEQRRVAWRAIKDALDKRAGIYTFYGDFGSGKTHALAVIVNECRDKLIESYYAPLASVLDHLRSLYGQKRDTSEYWQRLLDVPVLALDEVTRYNATDWAEDKLYVLADTRYRRRTSHLTLFATNDDPHKVQPPGEGIGYLASRMRESRAIVELRGDMRPAVRGAWWNE